MRSIYRFTETHDANIAEQIKKQIFDRSGALAAERLYGGGGGTEGAERRGGGHHRLLVSVFPCNAYRVNAKISHSRQCSSSSEDFDSLSSIL